MRAFLALLLLCAGSAAARPPIIDMHLHARRAAYIGENPPPMCTPFAVMPRIEPGKPEAEAFVFARPPCDEPVHAEKSDDAVMRATFAAMEKLNIIGVVSGEPDLMATWLKAAPKDRVIVGLDLRIGGAPATPHVRTRSPGAVRSLHEAGAFAVLAEVMTQYEGIAADDARLAPYWALAEELDIPVGIHTGPGAPADPYFGNKGYRARLGSPLHIEDVLVRHPKLRVYLMHAGYPFLDELRAVLFTHPQLYVELGSIVYTEPRESFYAFLKGIVDAGYGDRVMFGSDQMIWPGVIEPSVRVIEEAPFLDAKQKRAILYDNAARFLRLTPEEIAKHHRM